jgi:ATP-grasp domain
MSVATPPRFVAFVDDPEGLARVRERFGSENVLAVSTRDLGPDVRIWRRETLASDVSAAEEAHRARPFSGVLSWREPFVLVATRLAERLHLPSVLPDPMLARDKLRMKDALRTSVRAAESIAIRDADLAKVPEHLFPGVLKPRYAFASICAVRVDDARALRRELAEKRNKLVTTHLERVDLGAPAEPEFVLESFVGGSEHTVESFVAEGEVVLQIVSDKRPMVAPHFVETGDVMPSGLDEASRSRIAAVARDAIAALRIRYGWTHAEIKLWRGDAWVMEIAARMGGGYTRELVQAVYGLDMLEALFDYAGTGKRPVLGPPRGVTLGRRIVASGVSLVWGASAIDRLAAEGRITLVPRETSSRRRGLFLGVPFSYGGTIAAYLLSARDHAELMRLAAEVDALLGPKQVQIPVPRSLYRAYLRAKAAL